MTNMNVKEKIVRDAIVDEAKSWLGTPWHHQARIKGHGVDCGLFLIETYANVGMLPHFTPAHYPMDFMLHRSEEWFNETMLKFGFEITDPLPGDAVLFKHGRIFSHGGIVIGWPRIIHASVPDRCVCYGDASVLPLLKRDKKFFRHNIFKKVDL